MRYNYTLLSNLLTLQGYGPWDNPSDRSVTAEKLATDGSNWPLWQATILSFFKSKNLLNHIVMVLVYVSIFFVRSDYVISTGIGFRVVSGEVVLRSCPNGDRIWIGGVGDDW